MPIFKMKKKVGPHLFNGEWIRPGMTINCDAEEIARVMDKFEEVRTPAPEPETPEPEDIEEEETSEEAEKDEAEEEEETSEEEGLVLKHKGRGKYDVINSASGKVINDEPLTKKEAEKLIEGR